MLPHTELPTQVNEGAVAKA